MPNPLNPPFNYILRGHVDMTGIIALASTPSPGYGILADPPIVNNAQAAITIPGAPVANVFPSVYITSNGTDGKSIVMSDSGQFLAGNENLGLMMNGGRAPLGNTIATGGYSATQNVIQTKRGTPMAKKWRERSVCAPHSRSAGTSTGPRASCSVRVTGTVYRQKGLGA